MLLILFLFLYLLTGCSEDTHPSYGHSKMEKKDMPPQIVIDPARVQLYGITTQIALKRDLIRSIRTVGIVQADERRIYKIQTKFKGWIEKLYVDFTNKPVPYYAPLFSIYSPELYATQEEYLLALKGSETAAKGIYAQELEESNRGLLQAAKQRLLLWDVPDAEIARLEETKMPFYSLTFFSPIKGIVMEKNAYQGMDVGPGMNLFSIADLSWVWVMADVYEQDISLMKMGQEVGFTITAFPGEKFQGKVSFVNYVLDAKTRSVKVRLDIENLNYLLKPEMYGTVEIKVNLGKALAIPHEAVIDTGMKKIAFIDKGEGIFSIREVELGYFADGFYEVLSGIKEGEKVVTSAQFLLDSESRIQGAGMEM